MNPPNPPAENHYVPEFYLRRWAGGDGRLTRFMRVHGGSIHRKRVAPSAIGRARDIYTMEGQDRRTAYLVEEELFREVDDKAGKVLCRLEDSGPVEFNANEKSDWIRFLLRLVHAKPGDLETKVQSYKMLTGHTIPGIEIDDTDARNAVLSQLPIAINSRLIGQTLINMAWDLVDLSSSDINLLSSDSPVIMSNGLAGAEANWALPVSPTKLFLASRPGPSRDQFLRQSAKQIVRRSNQVVVGRARRFVISTDDSQHNFVNRHLGADEVETPIEQVHRRYAAGNFEPLGPSLRGL